MERHRHAAALRPRSKAHVSVYSPLARLRDQHDLLCGDPVVALRVPIRAASQAANQARAVSEVCVSDRQRSRMHRMREACEAVRRFVFRLALLLLLGAIINVAVAWGIAVLVDFQTRRFLVQYFRPHDQSAWMVISNRGFGSERVVSVYPIDVSGDIEFANGYPELPSWIEISNQTSFREKFEARGWPTLTLAAQFEGSQIPVQFRTSMSLGGIDLYPHG